MKLTLPGILDIERFDEVLTGAGDPVARARPRVAVVLAAGRSERLQSVTGGGSKALIRLGGLSIVERTVLTLLSYGLERIVVVTGYHAGPVGALVARIAPRRVHALYAEGWEAGNGASLGAAEADVSAESSFVLMTADHLFSDGALRDLIGARAPACLVDLAPDPATWREGTKVSITGGRVLAFGKGLDSAAVDCGAFLLTNEVFEHQRRALAEDDPTLAGVVTRFAQHRPMLAVSLRGGGWWQDVDTPEDLRRTRRRLRRSLAKADDGPVSRHLNRPVSTRISMALAPLRPSPDLVSLLVTVVGLVAAGLLAAGVGILGGLLVQAVSVLDGVDGELARLQLRARPVGALLDGVLDRIVDAAIVAGLAVWALSGRGGETLVVGLAVAATVGSILSMASKDRMRALGLPRGPERAIGFTFGGRDGRLLLAGALAIAGRPVWALLAIAITSGCAVSIRVILAMRSASSATSGARALRARS